MTAVAHTDNGAGNGRLIKDIFCGDMTRLHAVVTGDLGKQREQLLVPLPAHGVLQHLQVFNLRTRLGNRTLDAAPL